MFKNLEQALEMKNIFKTPVSLASAIVQYQPKIKLLN